MRTATAPPRTTKPTPAAPVIDGSPGTVVGSGPIVGPVAGPFEDGPTPSYPGLDARAVSVASNQASSVEVRSDD